MDSKRLREKTMIRKNSLLVTFHSQPPKIAWLKLLVNTELLLMLSYHTMIKANLRDLLSSSSQPIKKHKLLLMLSTVKILKAET